MALILAGLTPLLLLANTPAQGTGEPLPAPGQRSRAPAPAPRASVLVTAVAHGPYAATTDACAGCHKSHDASFPTLLAQGNDEAAGIGVCVQCHGPGGGAAEVSTHSNKDFAQAREAQFYVPCTDCHDPHATPNATSGDAVNDRMVRPTIAGAAVHLDAATGANSYDDGLDDGEHDSVCAVCHTSTTHNTITSPELLGEGHGPAGATCITCHPHRASAGDRQGFMESCTACHGGSTTTMTSGAHTAHFASGTGPGLTSCTDCHASPFGPTHNDLTVNFKDGGANLTGTTVCDACHSKGGAFDGVVEAKANWAGGTAVGCRGCHDSGTSTIKGVAAPNVAGDNTTYGYDVSGHGRPDINKACTDCHDDSALHFDGQHRTYTPAANNYQAGYRLKYALKIPLTTSGMSQANYDLCFSCHSYANVVQSSTATYFRDGTDNRHLSPHLEDNGQQWDSDWNGVNDSRISCPACHNVHGSPSVKMTQHGELTGPTYPVPALDFRWYKDVPFNAANETTVLSESRYGVCTPACHAQQNYQRDPSTPTPTPTPTATPTSTPTATPTSSPTATTTPTATATPP